VRQLAACALYLIVAVPFLCAQPSRWEGRSIAEIQFVPPAQPLDDAERRELVPLKAGTPLRMREVQAAIERLYATGRYEDIQVDAEPRGEALVLRFVTAESHFVGHVSVTGEISEPPNPGQLANATRLELGQPFSEDKITAATEGVKRLLDANGLFGSNVRPEYVFDPIAQQVHVRFVVDPGDRARLSRPALRGDLKMSPDDVVGATGWKRFLIGSWKPMTQHRVRRGVDNIRRKYEKQDRLEAKVALESIEYDSDTNRAQPTIEIDAGPRIQVRPVGAKISQKRLRQTIPIYEERAVDQELLVEGARNLQDWLQSQGYFEAEVEPKQQRVIKDRATIDYLINTGRRHKLVHIDIKGNRYFNTATLRERMFLQPASLLQYRRGRYSETLLRRDQDSISNLYRSNGFRDVVVRARIENDYRGKEDEIAVFIIVEEGPQWFVNNLSIRGIETLNQDEISGMLSSAPGQPFSEYNVSIDRDTILAEYFTRGFPAAAFEWNFKPAAGLPTQVDLEFVVREGKQQFVREVLVSGLNATDAELVRRNILLAPGDPLSPGRMTETQRRLYDLGVFAKVDTAIQNPEGETARKYVLYDMEEASRYSTTTGVGAEIAQVGSGCSTCVQNAAGAAGISPHVSFDITRFNMFGMAHSMSFRSGVSTLQKRGLLNYSAPRFRSRDDLNLSLTALYEDSKNVRTFASKRLEGSAQISQRFSKATTFFYRYSYRRVSVDSGTLKISPLLIPQLAQPVRLGMLSFNLIQDRRDDPTDPRRGIYNTVDLGLASHTFGSQRNFLRFLGRNASYHRLSRNYVLARDTSFGTIYAFRGQEVPLAERFFSGGGTSIRGFGELQAGPRDLSSGFPLGGTAILFNQTELRFPLIGENIGGVLFHDAGNVYSSLSNLSLRVKQRDITDFNYMVHAVGFGIRYRTPIGPLRIDLGYSINPPRYFGFEGNLSEFVNAGVDPCGAHPERCRVQRLSHFVYVFSIGQTF